jgi:hypothetical protein
MTEDINLGCSLEISTVSPQYLGCQIRQTFSEEAGFVCAVPLQKPYARTPEAQLLLHARSLGHSITF